MSFDPNAFLNQSVEGASSTKTEPVPEGEYIAVCGKPEIKTWASRDGSNSGLKLCLVWSIDDQSVKDLLGRDKVTSRQDIMLDLTDTGALDLGKGKNVSLGRLREAVNLNSPTKPFAFPMLEGQIAKVMVKHRQVDDATYDEVKGVAKA